MSHFALLWKARTIEKYRQRYEDEKINSIILSNANIPEKTLLKRWKHYRNDVKKHLSRTFSKWYPEGTTVSNFVINFGDMKFPHLLLRSAVGFLGGLILTYLCFVFFVFQLSISLVNATVLSSFIGILLTLGLTLSNRMRCLVFLLIPQLFSRVGRYTLTCYALVLILTGPATNTLKNSEVLSESMACSQEQIKLSVRQINESVKKPLNSIKDALNSMILDKMKHITWKLKVALVKTNRALITLASIIQSNFFWLDTVAKKCNAELGTPYERCSKSIKSTAEDYQKSPIKSRFTILIEVAESACEYLNRYEKFCVAPDFVKTTFLATIKRKLKTFTDRIKSMLFIHIKIQHSYTFIGNTSWTPSQVAAGIVTEIRNRADPIFTWLFWSSCVTSLFLLLIIFRAKHYQHMYETRSRFDNRYITKEFRELDLKRLREGRKTVLPLNRRERAKYVTTTSFRLVASEKVYMNRSAMFMTITTFKLLIHIVADYSLYWVLVTIRHHGSLQTVLRPGIPETGVRVSGQGFVARFLKSLIELLNVPLLSAPTSHNTCLPKPYPPDFKRYGQIGILIFLLWLFALFEPYGLRMRHLIMGHYRPERAKARAVWLYNHILRTRGSFMKFARRKLHRDYKYSSYRTMTFRRLLQSYFPESLLYLLGIKLEEPKCLLCNINEESNDFTEFIRCSVSNCPGSYCESCFNDIGRMCSICMSPQDYGDLSDVSLEGESSNDESDDDRNNDKGGFIKNNETDNSPDLEPDLGSDKSESDDRNSIYGTNHDDSFESFPLLRINRRNINQATLKNNSENNINCDPVKKINNINIKAMLDNYLKTNNFILTNKTVKLSQVTKKRLITTEVFQCWYSFYEMKIHDHRILVKRVRSINNKIRCRKSGLKKTKAVLNGNEKKIKNNGKDKNKETTDPSKTEKSNNDCRDIGAQINEDTKDNKKKTCNKKKNSTDVDSKTSTVRSKYMKYIFEHLLCTDVGSNMQKIPESHRSPTLSVKIKKKKRKKSNASPKPTEKKEKAKHNPLESRNSRIAAYLTELEWIKNKFEKKRLKNNTSLNNVELEEKAVENDVAVEQNGTHIKVYDVMIPKLKLNFSNDSVNKSEKNSINKHSETKVKPTPSYLERIKENVKSNTEYARIALDRYFKRMNYPFVTSNSYNNNVATSSVEIANHVIEDYEVQNNLLSNYDIPRTMKYFHSMHKDLDDNEKENKGFEISNYDYEYTSSGFSVLEKESHPRGAANSEIKENVETLNRVPNKADLRQSSDDLSTGWSRLKSERSRSNRSRSHIHCTYDKGVLVCPSVCTCGCQKYLPNPDTMDRSAQIFHKHKNSATNREFISCEAQVNVTKSTCTCATQYCIDKRDVGTYRNVVGPFKAALGTLKPEIVSDTSIDTTETSESQMTLDYTTESLFTPKSETSRSKTDTTICSLAQIEYNDRNRKKRIKVITKANQSTLTDRTKVCDVSTVTDDWWSPIIEKKVKINVSRHDVEKVKRREGKKSREVRNRGMTAAGRIVKFRSHTQIIPRDSVEIPEDILSPTRYLLESQKYYNELFTSRFYSPHVLTMAEAKHQKLDKPSDKGNKRSHYRLSRKSRRLENCSSPRRMNR